MPPSDEARQRAYYLATAASYHERHVGEHCSFFDVGAGTGRAMKALATAFPQARVQGIEPVAELRQQAKILNGISGDDLREGDAVVETGVLHHIRHWPQAVAEMARVARYGVLISDTNNIGQGSPRTRKLKKLIKKLGLWNALVWLQTKGKMSKWSEGDGVYYSGAADLLSAVSHVAIVARRVA
jgi:ubiquinone/menaquinone biosynthesis C-methylase UbiE